MSCICNLSGLYEFNDNELDGELDKTSEKITEYSDELRRLYCLKNILLEEKWKRMEKRGKK